MHHNFRNQTDLAEAVALFRYGLIADIVREPPRTRGVYHRLRKIADREHDIPGSCRRKISMETIRKWVSIYRTRGFEGLYPKRRADRGKARNLCQEVVDKLLNIKEKNPALSVKQIIKQAYEKELVSKDTYLPPSTVHRLFERAGLMHQQSNQTHKDRRHFSFQYAGELYMSDVMHGPAMVKDNRRKRKTYLVAFLDDATRVIAHAQFCWSENAATFLPLFKKAVLRRGIPLRLYVDNGAAYRCRQLELICAKLGVTLIHARPYQPQGKGKIERYFRTVRQWLRQVNANTITIDELNRLFWAWVECEYHRIPHRGLSNQAPIDRWMQVAGRIKTVEPRLDLDDLFLWEAKRRVRSDRTVSLNGTLYEVSAELVGQNILLRYDPDNAAKGEPIQIWLQGKREHDAKVVDAYANCFVKRERPDCIPSTQETSRGLDFTKLPTGEA